MPFLEAAAKTTIVQLLRHKTTTESAYATPKRRVFRREASFAIFASPQDSVKMPNHAGSLQRSPSLLQAHSTSISSKADKSSTSRLRRSAVVGFPGQKSSFRKAICPQFCSQITSYTAPGLRLWPEGVEEAHVLDGKKKTSPDK